MLVLKKNDLIKLLGDELYGIELDYAMLRDIERRGIERRETLDIVGDLCEAYGYNRREVQERAQDRLERFLLRKDEIRDWDPYANIKLTELSKVICLRWPLYLRPYSTILYLDKRNERRFARPKGDTS
ncbi:hypothetical protein DWX55_06435 [Collinsella sp. AF19-7AC]|uniref:hypothetical protein n=1 Tax=unclassified Collinsella TaxID=2637548 RepID=UPI000E46D612|nr:MULTISPECIES: hypothetical protein [unclassified Collinsella]RGT03963.1 hypothetical protein DWX55_06435 [Collinsella sp. AF19-7AC]RGT30341.1 hypothetical protein DWX39_06565 [Collinsella sp. AF19-1LB]RHE27237.1 hypothetical protein DW754_06770 [Collinsella sp. AM29-10AC]